VLGSNPPCGNWLAALTLVAAASLALTACGPRQVRQAPPGFLPDDPILTGDEALDARVARARSVATLSDGDISGLRKSATAGVVGQDVVFVLAMAYLGRDDSEAAVDILRRWIELDDYGELAMAAFVDVALGAGYYQECIDSLDELLRQQPDNPWLHIARGVCHEQAGEGPMARYAYEQGMARIDAFGGHTGTLELELGLVRPPEHIPSSALHRERLALIGVLAQVNLVGHVALRHRTGVPLDELPLEPRLAELGGVTEAELDRIFLSRRDAFRHCQLLSKKRRKIPGGRLVVNVTVRGDGSPGDIEHVRSTFEVSAIPACLDEQIHNMWFPQPRYGRAIEYEYDFRMPGD